MAWGALGALVGVDEQRPHYVDNPLELNTENPANTLADRLARTDVVNTGAAVAALKFVAEQPPNNDDDGSLKLPPVSDPFGSGRDGLDEGRQEHERQNELLPATDGSGSKCFTKKCTPRAADDLAGLAGDYIDITAKGSRVRNRQTSISRSSFEQNLMQAGYQPTLVSSGNSVVSYELNGARYVVRDAATSTGGPTADFYPAGSSSFTLKVRFRG